MSTSLPFFRSSSTSLRPARRSNAGFSLAEVMLAVGIVSFGMLTMLGIMPVGLKTMGEAADATVRAQIVQRVAARSSLTPFQTLLSSVSNLTKTAGVTELYFDYEGFEQPAKVDTTRYVATLSLGDAASYPATTDIGIDPKTTRGAFIDTNHKNLLPVSISILRTPGPNTPFTYVILVPNQGT